MRRLMEWLSSSTFHRSGPDLQAVWSLVSLQFVSPLVTV